MDDHKVVAHGCRKKKKDMMWHERGKYCGLWPPKVLNYLPDIFAFGTTSRFIFVMGS